MVESMGILLCCVDVCAETYGRVQQLAWEMSVERLMTAWDVSWTSLEVVRLGVARYQPRVYTGPRDQGRRFYRFLPATILFWPIEPPIAFQQMNPPQCDLEF